MQTLPLPTLPSRQADSHKGDYGKILVIAGSETMIGAPALVARAALRTGSGLVRIALPKELIAPVLTLCPQATAFPWSATKIKDLLAFADEHDVLAVGPGLGTGSAIKRLILELLERHHGPMVFDADALNVLAGLETSEWPKRRNWGNIVLTPHMGEYMRLIGAVMKRGANVALAPEAGAVAAVGNSGGGKVDTPAPKKTRSLADDDDHQSDDAPSTADGISLDLPEEAASASEAASPPSQTARANGDSSNEGTSDQPSPAPTPAGPNHTSLAELLARATGTIVVLKGNQTVITDGTHLAINNSGNPSMATPGSGDALAGIIASLIGQKLPPLQAATLGVHTHGKAGDLARNAIHPNAIGILSTDLIEKIPQALAEQIT